MRRRTEEKRNAILKVARELFNEKGYHKTSMSEITEKVGGSKATLYGYFKSKEMLFQAVMADSSLEELRQNVPQSDTPAQVIPAENYRQMIAIIDDLHHSKDDIRKTLYRFSKNVVWTLCQPQFLEIYRMSVVASAKTKIGASFFQTGSLHLVDNTEKYFQRYQKAGVLDMPDVRIAAINFLCLIRGPIFERHLFGYGKRMEISDIAHMTRQAVDVFLKAYGTQNLTV